MSGPSVLSDVKSRAKPKKEQGLLPVFVLMGCLALLVEQGIAVAQGNWSSPSLMGLVFGPVLIAGVAALLWQAGVSFCPRNAAAQQGGLVSSGFEAFVSLFQDQVTGAGGRTRTRVPTMLDCCPTDDQAEVLVPDRIGADQILAIAVRDEQQAEKEIDRLSYIGDTTPVNWIIAPHLFDVSWSALVRSGQFPSESPFHGR